MLKLLLIIFLSLSTIAKANDQIMQSYSPANCDEELCECFYPDALNRLSDAIEEKNRLEYELELYKGYASKIESQGWYEDNTLVYGGLIGAVVLGAVIGYQIHR